MQVWIKHFAVDMRVKAKGIEFEIRNPDGKIHLGDVVLTKTGLVWCKGRTNPRSGKPISWNEFIAMMNARK